MNIQRDINPEKDNKLNKMLDAKFGKQTMTITTGDDVRKMKALVKNLEVLKAALEEKQDINKQLSMRQVKELHAGVRSTWRRPKVGKVEKQRKRPTKPSRMVHAVGRRLTAARQSGERAVARGMARRGYTGTGGAKDPVGGRPVGARTVMGGVRAASRAMRGVARGLAGVATRGHLRQARRGKYGTGGAKDPVRVPKHTLAAGRRFRSAQRRAIATDRRVSARYGLGKRAGEVNSIVKSIELLLNAEIGKQRRRPGARAARARAVSAVRRAIKRPRPSTGARTLPLRPSSPQGARTLPRTAPRRQRVRTAARLGLLGTGGRKDPVSLKPRRPSVRQAVGRVGAAIRQTHVPKVRTKRRKGY